MFSFPTKYSLGPSPLYLYSPLRRFWAVFLVYGVDLPSGFWTCTSELCAEWPGTHLTLGTAKTEPRSVT